MDNFELNQNDFLADITSRYDFIREQFLSPSEPDDQVFCYLIANEFETLDEDVFEYTDGKDDKGIDFYIEQGNVFKIYQCKSTESAIGQKQFDSTPVNELAEAIDFLLCETKTHANDKVQELKNRYHLNSDNKLFATLAIQGQLTAGAMDRLDEIRREYSNKGVSINLIDADDLHTKWNQYNSNKLGKPVKLTCKPVKDGLISMHGWCCGILRIEPFLDAMHAHGMLLFESNVRSNLGKSKVNIEISKTLDSNKGRKEFVHLNNGLVITCDNYKISDDRNGLTLNNAQIVNGCQTLNTIWQFYKSADETTKESIKSDLLIFAKIISKELDSNNGLVDRLVISSNNQNPMKDRNLKSNTSEQRKLQLAFRSESVKESLRYFYIRKDGEFDSYLKSRARVPKKTMFAIDNNRRAANHYRHVDNEKIAKTWWSWIGNGGTVNKGGVKFFSDSVYKQVFLSRPSAEY